MAVRRSGVVPFDGPVQERIGRQELFFESLKSKYQERDIQITLDSYMEQNGGDIPSTPDEFDRYHINMQGSVADMYENLVLSRHELRELEEENKRQKDIIEQQQKEIDSLKKQIERDEKSTPTTEKN